MLHAPVVSRRRLTVIPLADSDTVVQGPARVDTVEALEVFRAIEEITGNLRGPRPVSFDAAPDLEDATREEPVLDVTRADRRAPLDAREHFERAAQEAELRARLLSPQADALASTLNAITRQRASWITFLGATQDARELDMGGVGAMPWCIGPEKERSDGGVVRWARTRGWDILIGARAARLSFVLRETRTTQRGVDVSHHCSLATTARYMPGARIEASIALSLTFHTAALIVAGGVR